MSIPIDPQLAHVLENEASGAADIVGMRATYRVNRSRVAIPKIEMATVRDHDIDTSIGLWARQYTPDTSDAERSALVYFHGGGWVNGGVDTHDTMCRYLAHHSGAAVFSVEYRLAPENPFPAAADDAVSAVAWVARHATGLGCDPIRIGVGGDSAGGTLAIQAALSGVSPLTFMVLLYPVTDLRMTSASYDSRGSGPGLTRDAMRYFADSYLDGHSETDPRVSPLLAPDLSSLPPTLVITAGHDPLHDEGVIFAARLADAGQRVVAVDYPRMTHGFAAMGGAVPEGEHALGQVAAFIAAG